MTDTEVLRRDNGYELRVDGKVAGLAAFLDHDNQRVFHHTEINRAHRGEGLSTVLIEAALTDTVGAGMRIVPVCPAVKAYLDKENGFAESVDPVTDEIFDWLEAKFQKR